MARELRPRFEVCSHEAADALLERVALRLRSADCAISGYVAEQRIVIYVPPARQRLWSAELRVDVVCRDGGTVLAGMYAPHPHVWVTYTIVLAAVVMGVTAVLVFAFAQWSMNQPPVALYGLVPLVFIGAATYGLAFVGQGFASEEMDEMRAFLDDAVVESAPLRSHIRNLRPGEHPGASSRGVG
jgi:hypothetical protein